MGREIFFFIFVNYSYELLTTKKICKDPIVLSDSLLSFEFVFVSCIYLSIVGLDLCPPQSRALIKMVGHIIPECSELQQNIGITRHAIHLKGTHRLEWIKSIVHVYSIYDTSQLVIFMLGRAEKPMYSHD